MRIRRRALIPVALAIVALALFVAHPRSRSFLRSLLRTGSSPCLLLGPRGCQHADRVEVLANGRVIAPMGNDDAKKPDGHGRILFQATGDTVFTFRITRNGERLYEDPTFRFHVRPGDIFSGSLLVSDEKPTGYYGPPPKASFPAVAEGVPARVWCWFRRADHLHEDRLQVTLKDNAALAAFKKRVWWRGYRIVKERHLNAGKTPMLHLVRPFDRTIVEAWLELERWEKVRTVNPEVKYVY